MTNETTNQPKVETIDMKEYAKEQLEQVQTPQVGERLPSLKLEAGKIIGFKVDETKPFGLYVDQKTGTQKRILCVIHKDVKHNLWLNVKNPLYRQILERLAEGKNQFYVSTIGSQKETRYELVEFG